jgi:hypothetical protein
MSLLGKLTRVCSPGCVYGPRHRCPERPGPGSSMERPAPIVALWVCHANLVRLCAEMPSTTLSALKSAGVLGVPDMARLWETIILREGGRFGLASEGFSSVQACPLTFVNGVNLYGVKAAMGRSCLSSSSRAVRASSSRRPGGGSPSGAQSCPARKLENHRKAPCNTSGIGGSTRPCNSSLLGLCAGQGRRDVQGHALPAGRLRGASRTRVRDPRPEKNHLPVLQGASYGEGRERAGEMSCGLCATLPAVCPSCRCVRLLSAAHDRAPHAGFRRLPPGPLGSLTWSNQAIAQRPAIFQRRLARR